MTNEELFQDLKQFITATVSQEVNGLRNDVVQLEKRLGGVEQRIDRLDNKLDHIKDAIADTLTQVTEALDVIASGHPISPAGVSR